MQVFNVTESPVYVRRYASSSSNIINIVPVGGKVYVIGEESGWYRTSAGNYVFKTENLKPEGAMLLANSKLANKAKSTSLNVNIYPPATGFGTTTVPYYTTGASGIVTAEQMEQISGKKDKVETSSDTRVSNADITRIQNTSAQNEQVNGKLTKEYIGKPIQVTKVVAVDEKGQPIKNADGSYQMVDVPEDAKNGATNSIKEIMEGGRYVRFETADGKVYIADTSLQDTKVGTVDKDLNDKFENFKAVDEEQRKQQEDSILEQLSSEDGLFKNLIKEITEMGVLKITDLRTVFGIPYQFMPIVDPRTTNKDDVLAFSRLGRKYSEKIVARAPILYMQPGTPVFMRGYSKDAKDKIIEQLVNKIENKANDTLENLIGSVGGGQYYCFESKPDEYFAAVNSACNYMAHILNIESVRIPSLSERAGEVSEGSIGEMFSDALSQNSLGNINWYMRTENQFGFYGGAVAFYINSENQVQESMNNDTRDSELTSKINQMSDQILEAQFIMGGLSSVLDSSGQATLGQWAGAFANGQNSLLDGSESRNSVGLMDSIVKNMRTLISGGKMIFPQIWADSKFGRSYNVTIKLNSPESDDVSVYLNVLVPLAHILGFVLPRSAGENSYVSPFLVRCFYKSMFHVDMGIIKSCEIVKGDQGAWNQNGLPTQITVQLQIQDLYSQLSQSMGVGSNCLISNPAQMDYLASLCGVHVAPSSFTRSLELWWMAKGVNRYKQNFVGSFTALLNNVFKTVQNFHTPARWCT